MRYAPDSAAGRVLAGDRRAVAETVRWISRVLASPRFWALRGEWTDLVQDVMGRVIESLRKGRFDPGRDFRTYVQGVARFTAFDAVSHRLREVQPDEDDPDWAEPAAAAAEAGTEDRLNAIQLARHVLDRATEGCRALLTSYFVEQKTYSEIASEMEQPVGTVKSRLFRCLDAARVVVGGRGAARGA